MDYHTLIAEHEAIEHAAHALIRLTTGKPRPEMASHMLEDLADLVRDHLSHEDPIVYETAKAMAAGRHGGTATASLAAFEELKGDWGDYLLHWNPETVAGDWAQFAEESVHMLERLKERVAVETAVLYSLAVHHKVLEPGESRPEPF